MLGTIARALLITALTVGALWFYVHTTAPEPNACRVTYVYDGDTVAMDCGTGELTARIEGLNAPETRDAQCDSERALGKQATARLRALIKGAEVRILRDGYDKYGRDLIRLWVNDQEAAQILVRENLAEPYFGGKRRNWCIE